MSGDIEGSLQGDLYGKISSVWSGDEHDSCDFFGGVIKIMLGNPKFISAWFYLMLTSYKNVPMILW
jgi:hypothetical protein